MTNAGQLIKSHREKNKLSQKAFAGRLGCTDVFICRIETGVCQPPAKMAHLIAKILNIPKAELLEAMNKDNLRKLQERST